MDDDAGGCVGELGNTYCGAPVFMHVAEAEDVWPLESGQAGRQAASVSVVAIRYMQLMDILVQMALHNCTPISRETH